VHRARKGPPTVPRKYSPPRSFMYASTALVPTLLPRKSVPVVSAPHPKSSTHWDRPPSSAYREIERRTYPHTQRERERRTHKQAYDTVRTGQADLVGGERT
jgi:hypothetical protein